MAIKWPHKDPDEILDYGIDWGAIESDRLGDDVIVASEWVVPTGLVDDEDAFTDTTVTIRLSGGSLGETYELVNRITTDTGQILDQTVRVKIKTR